jgi:DnaJ-class molecular chaperone
MNTETEELVKQHLLNICRKLVCHHCGGEGVLRSQWDAVCQHCEEGYVYKLTQKEMAVEAQKALDLLENT